MKELSTRQFLLLVIFLFLGSKLMSMPPQIYDSAGNDALMSIILGFVIELCTLVFVVFIIKRNPDTSFFELLKQRLGKFLAYFLYIIFLLVMLTKLVFLFQQIYTFFIEYLYDSLLPIIFALPSVFIVSYLAFKGPRTFGRVFEIVTPFIVFGILLTVFSGIEYIQPDKMLPFFDNGFGPTLNGLSKGMFYFSNIFFLLFFMGKVDFTKYFATKVLSTATIVSVLITGISFIFYSIYGYATQYTLFSLTDITLYDPYILDLGRLNWLSSIIDIMMLYCAATIIAYIIGQIGKEVAHTKTSLIPLVVAMIIAYVCGTFANFDIEIMQHFIKNGISYISIGLIALYLIIMIILLCKRSNKCLSKDIYQKQ